MLELVLSGLFYGSITALIAIAIMLIYKVTRVINFAQGHMAAFATYITLGGLSIGMHWGVAIGIALGVSVGIAIGLERLIATAPRTDGVLNQFLVTIGVSFLCTGLINRVWGGDLMIERLPLSPFDYLHIGGIQVPVVYIISIATAIAVGVGVTVVGQRTRVGLQVRAIHQNRSLASAYGVPVRWLCWGVFGIAALVAAGAALLASITTPVDPHYMTPFFINALILAYFCGFETEWKAIVFGLKFGVLQNISLMWFPEYALSVVLVINIIAIHYFAPHWVGAKR